MKWQMQSVWTYMDIHNVIVDTGLIFLQYFEKSGHIFTGGEKLQVALLNLKREDHGKIFDKNTPFPNQSSHWHKKTENFLSFWKT